MLTGKEKTLLRQILVRQGVEELTLQHAEQIAAQTKIPLRAVEWFALDNNIPPLRYQRNFVSLSLAGQKKLLESKAIIAGLGGLGGFVLEELARIGLGRIVSIDPEVFDETNLNRQLLSAQANLGKKKVAQARTRLKKINKAVEFKGFAVPLDRVPKKIWQDTDLVFDCLDNIESRFALANKSSLENVPLVHGAIAGWFGQVAVIWPGSKILEKVYKGKNKGIEKRMGTPPFTAAVAASLMVAEAIKILTGKSLQKQEKMQFFDLLGNEWQRITF